MTRPPAVLTLTPSASAVRALDEGSAAMARSPLAARSSRCVRNADIESLLVRMSLNIPSNLVVNWYPHSVFSFTTRLRSASSLVVLPPNRRLDRCS